MTNKELIERYPFLIPKNVWTGVVVEDYDLNDPKYTLLDDVPEGWRKAFGEQMCEEIRNALLELQEQDPNGGYEDQQDNITPYLYGYMPVQIKEKYGELRWYDNGAPRTVYDIIDKYSRLSQRTCINCGKPAKWISKGWICPWCDDCIREDYIDYVDVEEWFKPDEEEDESI